MNKKLLFVFLFAFLLLGSVSAVSKTYDEETQTVTIKDTFLLIPIGDIAEARLTTPLKNKVGLGYQKVAEFEISGKKDWADLFYRDIKTYDKKKYDGGEEKELSRGFDWKYLTYESVEVPDNTCSENYYTNGTAYTSCVQTGSHWIEREKWLSFDKNTKIKSGESYTIGLFTDVKEKDYIEWIPNFAGKEIEEWASWIASLDTGLINYYQLNASSGTLFDSIGNQNSTANTADYGATGIIENALDYESSNSDWTNLGTYDPITSNVFSISIWIKPETIANNMWFLSKRDGPAIIDSRWGLLYSTGSFDYQGAGTSTIHSNQDLINGDWQNLILTSNSSYSKVYYNGSLVYTGAVLTLGTDTTASYEIGSVQSGVGNFDGILDEIGVWNRVLTQTEITLLSNAPPYGVFAIAVPSIILNSPADSYLSNLTTQTFNVTVTDTVGMENVSLLIDGSIDQTNTSQYNGTYIFTKTLTEGTHNWSILAYDNDTNNESSATRTLTIDTTSPTINITSPTGTFDLLYENYNLTLNFTANDTNLDTCIYEYAGINKTLSCSSGVLRTDYFNYSIGNNSLIVYANDTAGNLNSLIKTWDYKVIEISQVYNNQTTEGSSEDFEVNLKIKSGLTLSSAIFRYGNETQSPSISSSGEDYTLFIDNYMIPNIESDQNITWFFEITLSDATQLNTTSLIQNVKSINIDDCSSYSNKIYSLDLKDEETYNNLTGDIDVILEIVPIGNGIILANYSNEFNGVQFKTICSSINLSDSNLILNSIIRYGHQNYTKEFYHIQKASLSDYPVNIELYDIPINKTTEFKVVYQNEDLVKVAGAVVQLLRQRFDNGNFILVEAPLTSTESTALIHVNVEANKYKINVVKDGVLLNTFDDIVFKCENELTGECSFDLFTSIVAPNLVNIENLKDFSYSISEVNNTITIPFTIPSGTPNNIRVVLTQSKITGDVLACNTSVFSSSGSISCNFNDSIDESTLGLKIYKAEVLQAERGFLVQEDLSSEFNKNNLFIVLILLFSLVGMFVASPEWMIVISIVALVVSGSLWLLNGMNLIVGLGGLAWLIVIAIILIKEISKQEDR